jgi:hypothetical protein
MDGSMFSGLEKLFKYGFIVLCMFIPLGLWKLVEIVIWCWKHINITLS